jgi:hypothetical protein
MDTVDLKEMTVPRVLYSPIGCENRVRGSFLALHRTLVHFRVNTVKRLNTYQNARLRD